MRCERRRGMVRRVRESVSGERAADEEVFGGGGGNLGNVGDAEPLRVLAASLLVGASPDREGEENPEADDLHGRRGSGEGGAAAPA